MQDGWGDGLSSASARTLLKRLVVGRPLATAEQEHQRIPKVVALAVFSSDAISSTAYAPYHVGKRH